MKQIKQGIYYDIKSNTLVITKEALAEIEQAKKEDKTKEGDGPYNLPLTLTVSY